MPPSHVLVYTPHQMIRDSDSNYDSFVLLERIAQGIQNDTLSTLDIHGYPMQIAFFLLTSRHVGTYSYLAFVVGHKNNIQGLGDKPLSQDMPLPSRVESKTVDLVYFGLLKSPFW